MIFATTNILPADLTYPVAVSMLEIQSIGGLITMLCQSYEWATMILIISIQKH